MGALIELRDVYKSYGNRAILRDISFSVDTGDLITIMGESGAGKSTLLNILAFFEPITNGSYYFEGKEAITNMQRAKIRNSNMGFVFQAYNLIPKLTVYENIVLPILYSMENKKAKQEYLKNVPQLIERFNLKKIENSYVDYISGGEKQRVCLARALATNPKLIISDEPTGNLDSNNANQVLNEFKRMNEEGKTVIIVTHSKKVQDIASKRYILNKGELLLNV